MRKSDTIATDILLALLLLTRLPLPGLPQSAFVRQARAVWAFPVAGVLLGGVATGAAGLALIWWPPTVAAGLAIALQVLMTGALHEDGLADTADGFWGGFDRDRRLEIMKDSQIGTYGVLSLVLSVGLRWSLLAALLSVGAIWAPVALAVLSRATMPVLMIALPHARADGLSKSVGKPAPQRVCLGLLLALGMSLGAVGWPALVMAAVLCPLCFGIGWLARAKIGGQTGDVLGTTQQISEIFAALVLLACL